MVVLLHRRATLPKPGRSCVRGRPRSPRPPPPLSFKYAIMVRIHAAALLWAWAQISSGGNGASAGSDTRALLILLCTHEHDASRTSLAHLLMPFLLMPLFTGVRGRRILRTTSPLGGSPKFAEPRSCA